MDADYYKIYPTAVTPFTKIEEWYREVCVRVKGSAGSLFVGGREGVCVCVRGVCVPLFLRRMVSRGMCAC